MSVYMIQFTYTTEAWAALIKNPADRSEPIRKLAESLGAEYLALYYCFGEYDGLVLFEAPDDVTAAAVVLAAGKPGHLKSVKTTKLLTVEETMRALQTAGQTSYSRPQ
jgi:uncharacterized protein with GYD domain